MKRFEPDVGSGKRRHLPLTRGECIDGDRPCPFVSCRHHLYLDVTDTGSIKLNFPDLEPDELAFTCALDLADTGGVTLEQTGAAINVTRERIRQIEERSMKKLRRVLRIRKLELDDLVPIDQAISWFGERA